MEGGGGGLKFCGGLSFLCETILEGSNLGFMRREMDLFVLLSSRPLDFWGGLLLA